MKKHILYLSLSKKEQLYAWPVAIVFLVVSLLLGTQRIGAGYLATALTAILLALICRHFWQETLFNIPFFGWKLLLRPVLAVVLHLVLCTFINDILMLMQAPYFVITSWGPILFDIQAHFLQAQPNFWLLAAALVLVFPIVEELIFRQLIFSTIHPKSRTLAILLSVVLFVAFHLLPYLGRMDALYYCLYTFQYLSMALFLCWLYLSTDSLAAPIVMHMLLNAITVRHAWTYMLQ